MKQKFLKFLFTRIKKHVKISLEDFERTVYNKSVRYIYMNGEAMKTHEPRQIRKEAAISG